MRIISQSGNTDINYDNCVIIVDDNVIEAHVNDEVYNLGIYSSEAKVKKVIKVLHELYASGCKSVQFPKDEDVEV